MIKLPLLLVLAVFAMHSYSQTYYNGDTVFVEACTNCLLNNASYNSAEAFHTRNIISDFGPRNYPSSFWHGGVDYTAEDVEDHGYHILAVESGTITRMRAGAGQKYPEIVGANMHLMYNHCFTSNSVSDGLREGDLELVSLDFFNDDNYYRFGIIHYRTYDTILLAACPENNCNLAYKLINPVTSGSVTSYDTLYASNTIERGQVIGSLGTSFGNTTNGAVGSHLHLQRFKSVNGGYDKENLIDPLEAVRHQGPHYEIDILKNEGTAPDYLEGVDITYGGATASSILVRPKMPDVNPDGTDNNGYGDNFIYFQNTMNIDRVTVKVRNHHNDFDLIQGPTYESKIWLGARQLFDIHYPNTTEANVLEHEGNWSRQTIDPFCYSNRLGRWDDYYYSDFVTRIHADDVIDDGTTLIADCPLDARYNDGCYEIYAEVEDVRGTSFYSDTKGASTNRTHELIVFNA